MLISNLIYLLQTLRLMISEKKMDKAIGMLHEANY